LNSKSVIGFRAELDLLPAVNRVLGEEFPGIEIRLSSDYSPLLAKALMRRKLDAAFMRPEENMGDLACRHVRTDPLVVVFPSDHRLASQTAIAPQEIVRRNTRQLPGGRPRICSPNRPSTSESQDWRSLPLWRDMPATNLPSSITGGRAAE
jgi:DNA-binding transcriptional LysR family regulator